MRTLGDGLSGTNSLTQVGLTQEKFLDQEKLLDSFVRIDTSLRFATVVVRGALTDTNCDSLFRVIERTAGIAERLRVRVDLSDADELELSALTRLREYSCDLIGEADGPLDNQRWAPKTFVGDNR